MKTNAFADSTSEAKSAERDTMCSREPCSKRQQNVWFASFTPKHSAAGSKLGASGMPRDQTRGNCVRSGKWFACRARTTGQTTTWGWTSTVRAF